MNTKHSKQSEAECDRVAPTTPHRSSTRRRTDASAPRRPRKQPRRRPCLRMIEPPQNAIDDAKTADETMMPLTSQMTSALPPSVAIKDPPTCPICLEDASNYKSCPHPWVEDEDQDDPCVLNCGHTFHQMCLVTLVLNTPSAKCPVCRADISGCQHCDGNNKNIVLATLHSQNTMRHICSVAVCQSLELASCHATIESHQTVLQDAALIQEISRSGGGYLAPLFALPQHRNIRQIGIQWRFTTS